MAYNTSHKPPFYTQIKAHSQKHPTFRKSHSAKKPARFAKHPASADLLHDATVLPRPKHKKNMRQKRQNTRFAKQPRLRPVFKPFPQPSSHHQTPHPLSAHRMVAH